MKKLLARIFFCGLPAVVLGLPSLIVHPAIGGFVFGAVFYFGWQVTEARPERGEARDG